LATETPPSKIGWSDDSKAGIGLTNAPRKMSSYEKQTLSVQDDGAHGDGESQTYLRVAEIVLSKAMTPLKAREIVDRGIEQGLFGDHVMGRTPEKSMQARQILVLHEPARAASQRGQISLRFLRLPP
jgi:hypothetical protein